MGEWATGQPAYTHDREVERHLKKCSSGGQNILMRQSELPLRVKICQSQLCGLLCLGKELTMILQGGN